MKSPKVGIYSGPVVAGVIGQKKFAYDIWEHTVNMAARMESASASGRVNVGLSTQNAVRQFFETESRGEMPVKGSQPLEMSLVSGLKDALREGGVAHAPNARFHDLYAEIDS